MKIKIAKSAGFCFGVERAVSLVEETAKQDAQVFTLGPIIHNHHVVQHFEQMGVKVADDPSQLPDGCYVVIRSHGVSRKIYEELENRNVHVVDATCPFVKRIHVLVMNAEKEGRRPLIIGTRSHPEVKAIAGWCEHPLVFESVQELEDWTKANPECRNMPISVVSQTTSTKKIWESCEKFIKKEYTNYKIFDTICKATENRQAEAASLACACDAVVVVGDVKSSNTGRLAMICRQHCPQVYLVDQASDLNPEDFQNANTIGITAGASTPAWIIKEVKNTMSETKNVDTAMEESFEAMLDASIKTLNTGDRVVGTVVAIGTTEVQVDLGTKHAGYIPVDEVSADPTVKPEDVLKVGDEIEVFVVRVNDSEGTVQLSKKKLEGEKVWNELETLCEEKTVIEARITDENKGGLVANYKGVRVFIPASQSGVAKGGELSALKNTTQKLRITEVNRAHRRVVGSIRSVLSEERKAAVEAIWANIEVGKKYQGTVKSLTSYGAFVDIGGVDGMVHVSELSWARIKKPSDVVKVGDKIEVYVISFDPEKRKISLGYKTAETNPWNLFLAKYHVGDVVNVKVVKLMTFGAFAEIMDGVDGLIHISQIADRRIGKPEDVLSEGQQVDAKIIGIDEENKRISLSIRALSEPEETDAE